MVNIKCKNNCGNLEKMNEFFALTRISQKDDLSINFMPSVGIPLIVFICPKCGYLELYNAVITKELKLPQKK